MAERLSILLMAPLLIVPCLWGCTAEPTSQAPTSQAEPPASVSSTGPGGNHPPAVLVASIFPVDVTIETTLRIDAQGEDMDGDRVTYRYQWLVNGVPESGATEPQFSTEKLKNGDRIVAQLIPNDGKADGAVFTTDPVTVGNTAPDIAEVHLEPVPIKRAFGDDSIECVWRPQYKVSVVAGDPDGDPVTLTYKWLRNDKEIPGAKTDTLDTKDFRKKDVLTVLVTPSDGKATREGHAGFPVTIENSAPCFTSKPPAGISLIAAKEGPAREGSYEYAVTAVDPDEDPVTFELKKAPPGMTIDAATGKVTWKLTVENKGKHRVVIAAKDNDKGVTQQEFELDIPLAQPAAQGQ